MAMTLNFTNQKAGDEPTQVVEIVIDAERYKTRPAGQGHSDKIPHIKVIRAVFGWGLKEAKDFIEGAAPSYSIAVTEGQIKQLRDAGFDVRVSNADARALLKQALVSEIDADNLERAAALLALIRKHYFAV